MGWKDGKVVAETSEQQPKWMSGRVAEETPLVHRSKYRTQASDEMDARVAKERAESPVMTAVDDTIRGLARGIPVLGGLADEGNALLASGLNTITAGMMGAPYEQALEYERAKDRAYDNEYPVRSFATKLAGGIASAPLTPMLGASTTLGRIGAGAVTGAAYGGAHGFTEGQGGFTDRLGTAGDGAVAGGVLGGVIPAAISAVQGAYSAGRQAAPWLRSRLPGGSADDIADSMLAARIERSGLSAQGIADDLARGRDASRLGPNSSVAQPEMIADTADSMQRLLGSVYRQGGEAGDLTRGALEARQLGDPNRMSRNWSGNAGQAGRLEEGVGRALQVWRGPTARTTERNIMAEQARQGRKLYDEAFTTHHAPFDVSPAMMAFTNRMRDYQGPFRATMQKAYNLFTSPEAGFMNSQQRNFTTNLRRFDNAKKQLDDMIETAQRGGENNLARELTQFKRELLDQVHGVDPRTGQITKNAKYQEARDAWGSAAENREAIDLGRAALREGSEVSVEQFNALTPGQQQLFRVGFMESLRNHLGRKRGKNDATMLFQEGRVQDLMRAIVPNTQRQGQVFSDRSGRLGEFIGREQRMGDTRQKVLGNSVTQQRAMDDADFAADALSRVMMGARGFTNTAIELVGSALQKVTGVRQDVALSLARRLTETDPQQQAIILRQLQTQLGRNGFRSFISQLNAGIPATAALSAGNSEQ